MPGFDEFGKQVSEDKNNIQPRIGAVYDLRGDGKDVVRAGWGTYYDFGYTNANILFPGLSAQGDSGVVFTVTNSAGIKNPDGSFFQVGQPISNIASQNEVNPNGPFFGTNVMAPEVRQPWTAQTSLGWSHELTRSTVFDADFVDVRGHDLGVRWALNTKINNGARRYAGPQPQPGQPVVEHERRVEQVPGHQLRRPPPDGSRRPAERLVHALEGRPASAGSAPTS